MARRGGLLATLARIFVLYITAAALGGLVPRRGLPCSGAT